MNSKEWKDVKLKDITILISRGITPKYTDSEGVIVINQKCIRNGQINLKESRLTDDKTKKISENKFVDNNDILICSTGIGTLGRVGFLRNKLNTKLTVDSHVSIVRANKDYTNPIFLGYNLFLRQSEIEAMAKGSTGQTELSRIDLGEMNISLPPLEIQEKIASILSSLDDKIELNNKINQNLEQQAQAIFKSWFVDFEPFGGKMPEDWRIGALGEYIEIKRGGSPRPIQNFITDKGYKWLKISDVTSLQTPFIYDIKESIKESGLNKTVLLKAGTLVLSNSATPGIPKILGIDSCIHDGWLYFPESKFSNEYLYLLFKSIRKNLVSLGNGSVFTNLKTDILRNYQTVLSSESVLKNFDSIVKPIFSNIQNNTLENINLTQLRDTLLPKLMSGEIDVDKVEV